MDYFLVFLVLVILIAILFLGYKVFWIDSGGSYIPGSWPSPVPRPPAPSPTPGPTPSPGPAPGPAPGPPPKPFPNRYDCFKITNGFRECIPTTNGIYSSLSHCKTACPSSAPFPPGPKPPRVPKRHACFQVTDNFARCLPSKNGEFASKAECVVGCGKVPDHGGGLLGQFSYECNSGKCEKVNKPPDGKTRWKTIEECNASCGATPTPSGKASVRWMCDGEKCVVNADGKYTSPEECEKAGCGATPTPSGKASVRWMCDGDQCVVNADGKYTSPEECEKAGCGIPTPSGKASVRWMCDGDKCVVNADGKYTSLDECEKAGCGKIPPHPTPHGNKCLFKKDFDPNTDIKNLQEWIDENIMMPMDGMGSAAKQFKWFAKGTGAKIDNSSKQFYKCSVDSNGCLCSVDASGTPLLCQENVCPYGTFYDPDENAGKRCQNCPDDPFSSLKEGFVSSSQTIRGVKSSDISKISDNPTKKSRKIILTDYSFPGHSIYGPAAGENGDNIALLLDDMINNFCINASSSNHKVDIYSMYVHTIVSKYGIKNYSYFMDPAWIYKHFLKKCKTAQIEPGITIYPDYAWIDPDGWGGSDDPHWIKLSKVLEGENKDDKVWIAVGYYINLMNSYANSKGGASLINYLVYDSEAVPDKNTKFNNVRKQFAKAPIPTSTAIITNPIKTNWNTFYLMTSKGPGFKMESSNNAYDIGLGEVYWNVGQSWPCKGNASQYSKYTPTCKELSSHVAFKDDWKKYLVYLNNSAKAEAGGGQGLSNNYILEPGKSRTMPLFSTEALYSDVSRGTSFKSSAEESGLNFTGCAATAYFSEANKKEVPTMNDKVCGTFDGFSYWTRENFFKFVLEYSNMYMPKNNDDGVQFIGIYAPAFIPNTWMRSGKFQNQQYAANTEGWPVDCRWKYKNGKPLSNKCGSFRKTCNDKCTNDNDCMKCAPEITGYCKDNGFCHYNN